MVSNNNLRWLNHSCPGSGGFSPPCSYPNPATATATEENLAFDFRETDSYKDFVLDVLWRSVFTTKTIEILHTPHPGRIKTQS